MTTKHSTSQTLECKSVMHYRAYRLEHRYWLTISEHWQKQLQLQLIMIKQSEIWCSHCGEEVDRGFLDCDIVWSCKVVTNVLEEDGGDTIARHVGNQLQDNTASQSRTLRSVHLFANYQGREHWVTEE
jgi:hypothetical protein